MLEKGFDATATKRTPAVLAGMQERAPLAGRRSQREIGTG